MKITNRLLKYVETLSELKSGKMCRAWVSFGMVFGIGKFSTQADDGMVEHYVLPFTIVSVFTPNTIGTNELSE